MRKSKRFGAILLALVMLTVLIPALPAATAATDGDYEYEVTDGNATITGYIGDGGDITIPNSVTSIGTWAFYGCPNLVISCNTGSYAHTFAKENSLSFVLPDAPVTTYTVKFNKNGGSGSMASQTIITDKSTKLTANSFTKAAAKTVHTTKLTYTLKSLSAKTTYYVRVTAYKPDSTKAKIYSKKTAAKNLKTK